MTHLLREPHSNMYIKLLVSVLCCLTYVSADLPVLFQFSQPTHNVAVYRGADLEKARAAGLINPAPAQVNYRPAPLQYRPSPAPVVYRPKPATVVVKPAPVVYKPAPTAKPARVVYRPAPVAYKPVAPVVYKPAPTPAAYRPAPVKYAPAASYVEPNYNDLDAVYNWEYAVLDDYSSNNFGHKESRNGALTQGKYYVSLPDGRLQTVTYNVDGYGGYVPVVEYSGEAQYPAEQYPAKQYTN